MADGSTRQVFSAASTSGACCSLAWAPDGHRLAFETADPSGVETGIFALDIDQGQQVRLTAGEDRFPAWSPDGTWILFSRKVPPPFSGPPEDPPGDIWVVPAAGSRAPWLVTTGATADW